jgi:Outer membrane protein beta-barrel domain
MDKHLHKNIGEKFSEEINSMSRQPREHVWENIDKALDKTDVKSYKEKFTRLKKRSLLLLLLLIGLSTFSLIYFTGSRNDSYNNSVASEKSKTPVNNAGSTNKSLIKPKIPLNRSASQNNDPDNNALRENFPELSSHDLSVSEKLFLPRTRSVNNAITTITDAIADAGKNHSVDINSRLFNNALTPILVSARPQKPELIAKLFLNTLPAPKRDSFPLITLTDNASQKSNARKPGRNSSRFSLTIFYAADYSAYRLTNDMFNNYDNGPGIATRERSDLSTSAGLLLGYRTGKKISIQSGIIYSSSQININPTKIYAEKNNAGTVKFRYNTSSGYGYLLPSFSASPAVGDSLFADGANHTLQYISIPLLIKYNFGNKRTTFHPGIGITFNFLKKATLTTDLVDLLNREKEVISNLEGIKKINASLLVSPELRYQLSKKVSISGMPYFKYSLGAINKGNVVKTYPYTVGLGVGIVYKF